MIGILYGLGMGVCIGLLRIWWLERKRKSKQESSIPD